MTIYRLGKSCLPVQGSALPLKGIRRLAVSQPTGHTAEVHQPGARQRDGLGLHACQILCIGAGAVQQRRFIRWLDWESAVIESLRLRGEQPDFIFDLMAAQGHLKGRQDVFDQLSAVVSAMKFAPIKERGQNELKEIKKNL
jgi:hypothetical protein